MISSPIEKTCKLEYYIREMRQADKSEIIWLIDKDGERDFNIFYIKAITDFKELKPPVSDDSFEVFIYQDALNDYNHTMSKFETIFRRINDLFINNNVQPIFNDPTKVDECLDVRKDMLEEMSYERANKFFGVSDYGEYHPPVYKK